MSTKYASVPLVFARYRLALDIRMKCHAHQISLADVDVLAGVGSGYTHGLAKAERDNPQLGQLLAVCNALDLDIRKYFELSA